MNLKKALTILDVRGPLDERELKQSYLILVKSCHPDQFHNNETLKKEGEESLKNINLAYEYVTAHSSEFQAYNTRKKQEKPTDSGPLSSDNETGKDLNEDAKNGKDDTNHTEKQEAQSDTEFRKRGFFSKIHESVNQFLNSEGDVPKETPGNVHKKNVKKKSFKEILNEKDGLRYEKTKRRKTYCSARSGVNWSMLNRKHRGNSSNDAVDRIEPIRPVRGVTRKK